VVMLGQLVWGEANSRDLCAYARFGSKADATPMSGMGGKRTLAATAFHRCIATAAVRRLAEVAEDYFADPGRERRQAGLR
jgi:hypothetical protein